jgi:hypothetical protein
MTGQHGGFREGGGRPKGSRNLRTLEVEAKIQQLGCPFEAMARIAKKAEGAGDFATAGRLQAELARYLAPQRKAITHEGTLEPGLGLSLEDLSQLKQVILREGMAASTVSLLRQ